MNLLFQKTYTCNGGIQKCIELCLLLALVHFMISVKVMACAGSIHNGQNVLTPCRTVARRAHHRELMKKNLNLVLYSPCLKR